MATVENRLHFGLSIFEAELPYIQKNQQALAEHFLQMQQTEGDALTRSNHGGWHSQDNLQQSGDPLIQGLTADIKNISTACVQHAQPELAAKGLRLTSAWANINHAGHWNTPHQHLPCEWSGVAYIQTPNVAEKKVGSCQDGDILFFDPLPLGQQYQRSPYHPYTPKQGNMFIFPSYLLHMVAPHFEQEPRISVAFNFRLLANIQQIGV